MRQSGFCFIQIMISQIELHEADLKAMMKRIPNSSPDKNILCNRHICFKRSK